MTSGVYPRKSSEIRFWEKVDKSRECWEYQGKRNHNGYGRFWLNGEMVQAHRFAYESQGEKVPEGLRVLHTCDNPPCCRPDHLFVGTDKENAEDRNAKGRQAWGERNAGHKLTARWVEEIRRSEESSSSLAQAFGVHRCTISRIRSHKIWANL